MGFSFSAHSRHINAAVVYSSLSPAKDVDGFHR
jgi:5,10-methylene-tetrahydrofolate dehydrogenase/methenyl tetrahydrofolate cyclohydrolase